MALLRGIVEAEGVTVLVATHDPVMVALADRVLRIANGAVTDGPRAPRHDAVRTLLIRRARAQAGVLAGLLALVTLGVMPLGVAALLLGPSAQRAFDVAMARQPADAVDVTAYVTGVRRRRRGRASSPTPARAVTGILDPLPVTTAVRASSAVRALPGKRGAASVTSVPWTTPPGYVRVWPAGRRRPARPCPRRSCRSRSPPRCGCGPGDTVAARRRGRPAIGTSGR